VRNRKISRFQSRFSNRPVSVTHWDSIEGAIPRNRQSPVPSSHTDASRSSYGTKRCHASISDIEAPSGTNHDAGSINHSDSSTQGDSDSSSDIELVQTIVPKKGKPQAPPRKKKKGKGSQAVSKPKKLRKAAAKDDENSDDDAPYKNSMSVPYIDIIPMESLCPSAEMVLFIPRASSNGNQCVNLPLTTTYDSALEVIYETIGCDEVNRKPTLSYKLVSATAKTPATFLGSDNDWE
jgi:hypothetical protein